MSALLPTAMLSIAGALTLVMVWPRLREQPFNGRLIAEAVGTTLVAVAVVWAGWVLLWLMEQHW